MDSEDTYPTWTGTIDMPANTDVSKGFESILMHATSNNNPDANPKNFDSGLSYGDFYLVEAGNRLLEREVRMQP